MQNNFRKLPNCFLDKPIAHRGFHDCEDLNYAGSGPENSREAIIQACISGYCIEIDVRLSTDYVPIVIHDQNLLRLCKLDINVSETNSSVLFKARLRNGETIPSLKEILSLVDGKVPILIEVKPREKNQINNIVAKSIFNTIKKYNGSLALMSFSWSLIEAFNIHSANVPRGLVSKSFDEDNHLLISEQESFGISEVSLQNQGVSFIAHYCDNLSPQLFQKNILHNRKVLTWTICNKEMAEAAWNLCDNITFEGFHPIKKVR